MARVCYLLQATSASGQGNEQTAFELPLTDIFAYSELPLARDIQIVNFADRPEINLDQNDLSGWHGDKKIWSAINKTIKAKVEDGSNENKYLINVDHEPLDFDLRIKFRIARGNSGINFRNDIPVRLNQLYGSTRLHEFRSAATKLISAVVTAFGTVNSLSIICKIKLLCSLAILENPLLLMP